MLVDNLKDVVVSVSRDGNPKYCNPAVIAFGGHNPKEEIGEFIEKYFARKSELARAEKLESVGILAGGLAHDFNNILTAILRNVSIIKMQLIAVPSWQTGWSKPKMPAFAPGN